MPVLACASCRLERVIAIERRAGSVREGGERHENMYVTMLELEHLNL